MPQLPWDHDPTIPPEDLDLFYRISGLCLFGVSSRVITELEIHWDRLAAHKALLSNLYWTRGYCLADLDDLAGALPSLAEARRLDPDDPRVREKLRGVEGRAIELIRQHHDRRDWKPLEDLSRAFLAAFPETTEVEWHLAVSLDEQGRSEEGEAILRGLVKREPLQECLRHSLALALRHQNRIDETRETCREGIEYLRARGRDTGELASLLDRLETPGPPGEESPERPKARLVH